MSSSLRLVCSGFIFLIAACAAETQSAEPIKFTTEAIANPQTADYCEILHFPDKFKNKMIRVHAFYETDFEKSSIDLPSCYGNVPTGFKAMPMTWVDFDDKWESRTKRRVRHAVDKIKWHAPTDVVFIGLFKSDGHYGHEDMYPYLFDVYKVELVGTTK